MISAPNRCFSCERITRTTVGPPRCRSRRWTRSSASSLSEDVTETLRPVHSTAIGDLLGWLEALFALGGGRDPELLPVLGDRSARDLDSLGPELLRDPGVGVGTAGVLLVHDPRDLVLDRQRGNVVALRRVDAAVEEVLHREEPARRVHVLVGHDAGDRGFVHGDVVGDVAQYERPQVLDAVVEKLPLMADDRVGHLVDRPLALVQALYEPDRRAHLVLQIRRRLRADRTVAAAQQTAVGRRDAQLWQAVLGQLDDVFVADLADEDIRLDVDGPFTRVLAAGLGLEILDDLERRLDLRHADAEFLGQRSELAVQ